MKNKNLNNIFSENQKYWVDGFMTASATASLIAKEAEKNSSGGAKVLNILFGSQTGNSEHISHNLAQKAKEAGFVAKVHDMMDISAEEMKTMTRIVIIASTYGDGEPTDNAQSLYNELSSGGVDLSNTNYTVLGLGDSAYDYFCQAAIDFDKFFKDCGSQSVINNLNLDVDFEDASNEWISNVIEKFLLIQGDDEVEESSQTEEQPIQLHSQWTKSNPYESTLLNIKRLSSNDSSKEVNHFELTLPSYDDITYEAGDAIGIIPKNDYNYVASIMHMLKLDNDYMVNGKDLFNSLIESFEIRTPSKEFVEYVANNSTNTELTSILNDKQTSSKYLAQRELIDLIEDSKLSFNEETFVSLLKPLQHRLYSISSSPNIHNDEVHITVAAVKYDSAGRERKGVASCFLSDRSLQGDKISVFIHPNKNFSVPENDNVPMIMIGPGTGIAPFRSFIEERYHRGAKGENWLFFGDRTKKNDFLYQDELEKYTSENFLKLSLAWSRENDIPKTYVQDVMIEQGKEFFQKLEEGGYIFVCGDASRMAKDVDAAIIEIISVNGAMSIEKAMKYIEQLKKEKRYVRDVY